MIVTSPENLSAQIALELAEVAQHLQCSTVQVRSHQTGVGSGVIWHSDGLMITNAHVIRGSDAIVELFDGRVFEAVVTAQDPYLDLAALRVEATDLPAATIGNSDALRVGELVLAVGNPLGLVGALTTGIVHATGSTDAFKREVSGERVTPSTTQQWVMADVRLAPGNSGGSLANVQGQVIGINTMIADGLALAVPSNVVEKFLQGTVARPHLGVTLRPVLVRLENQPVLGLLVLDVAFDSLAMTAGLQMGDVLIGILGQSFNTPDDLISVLWNTEPGDVLLLEFLRNGRRDRITVVVPSGKDVVSNVLTKVNAV